MKYILLFLAASLLHISSAQAQFGTFYGHRHPLNGLEITGTVLVSVGGVIAGIGGGIYGLEGGETYANGTYVPRNKTPLYVAVGV